MEQLEAQMLHRTVLRARVNDDLRSRVWRHGAVELTLASRASVGELRAAIGHLNCQTVRALNQ
jgi:hypothetical protein